MVGLAGCVVLPQSSGFASRGGALWHDAAQVRVPDPAGWGEGWQRVSIPEADLAFGKAGQGVIAVAVSCPARARSLQRASRDGWLGIERSEWRRSPAELGGWPGIDSRGDVGGVHARMLIVDLDGCTLDLARVSPRPVAGDLAFERFLAELRLPEPPAAALESTHPGTSP